MEGKEVRFGIAQSALFATVTTDASCGAVNSMHDSFTPLGGLVPLFNMQTGEVIFGGVGAGLYGILLYCDSRGLHRRPDGRPHAGVPRQEDRAEGSEDGDARAHRDRGQHPRLHGHQRRSCSSRRTATGIRTAPTTGNLNNGGPHGFAEILYAYTSGTGNNGSAFAGITANTPWYNLTIGLAMLIGRFLFIIPLLAVAGSLAAKKTDSRHQRHVPDAWPPVRRPAGRHGVIVGALTFFPALSLGPIVEHFLMHEGQALLDGHPLHWRTSHDCHDTATPTPTRRLRRTIRRRCCRRSWRARGRCSIRRSSTAAIGESFVKLNPITLLQESGDVRRRGRRRADDGLPGPRHCDGRRQSPVSALQIALWLWFTVLFANFAEAMAEARGKAQADTLRKTKTDVDRQTAAAWRTDRAGARLRRSASGDVVVCEAGRPHSR